MKKMNLVAGTLGAVFLSVAIIALPPVKAGEPVLKGSVVTTDGVPAQAYPVIIQGKTSSGESFDSYATTDQSGSFQVKQLPPGIYTATPAGQPESSVEITVKQPAWYKFWESQRTTDLGKLPVSVGSKLAPNS